MDAPPQQPGQQAHNNTANTQATTDTVLPPVAVAAASPAEMSAPSSPSAVAVSAPPIAAVAPASSDGSSSSSSRRITRLHLESTRPLSPRSPTRYQPVSAALAAQNTAREWMRQNSQPTSPAQLDRESTLSDPAHGSLDRQQTSSHAARGRAAAAFPVAGAEASSSEAMRPQSAPSVQPAPRVSFSAGAEPTALQLADPTHVHVHVSLEGTPRHSFVMGAGAAGLVPRSSDESQRSSPRNSPRAPAGSMVAVSVSSTAGTVCSTGGGGGAKPSTRSHVSPLSIASIEMQAPLLPSPSERFDEISEQKAQLETPPLRPILRSATSFSPAPCPSPSPPQTPTAVPTLLNVRPPSLSRTNTASTVHRRGASGNVSFQGASNGLDDFDCEEHLPPLRAHMQAPRSRFFIDPDGRSKVLWSLALVLLIIYSLFEVPLSIGFSYTNTPASSAILYFIDCFFVLDVFLNFLTGFHDEQLELVTDMRRIARNYLRGWFVPDSLGSIPFELIALASGSREDRAKVFLVLRALKIPRLLRVVKLTAFFDLRSHRYLREGIRMVKLVFVMIVMGHWVACGFMLVANNEAEGVRTWAEPVRGHPLGEQFTFALYWSLTVLSTVGFGDIVPITQSEMMYTCAVMLMGAILYAVVVGNVMLVLGNLNASAQRHTEEIMKVGDYMRSRKFPPQLQQKVFDFTEAEWKRMQGYDEREIIAHLPAALQIEIARHLHAKMIKTVSFMQGSHAGFINEVVLALHTTMLLPGTVMMRRNQPGNCMFFVSKGSVELLDRGQVYAVLGEGAYVGESALLDGLYRVTARTSSYVELCVLYRADFDRIVKHYPEFIDIIHSQAEATAHMATKQKKIKALFS